MTGTEEQRQELLNGLPADANIVWVDRYKDFCQHKEAEAFIDLSFKMEEARIRILSDLLPSIVVINSVAYTLQETNAAFVRINGWPSFLSYPLIEAAGPDSKKDAVSEVFAFLGKKMQWLPDEPGFITPRVISMIINEAFLSLEEGVSSKSDIDTAMKLGTNYPYGPFEWADKIGMDHIRGLLLKLSQEEERYHPASLL